jgi:rubrerythrin
MHKTTANNLQNAYGGESMAHMRYLTWADTADREGRTNIARLFRAIAWAEKVHANNHFHELGQELFEAPCVSMAAFGIGGTSQNLQGGINGENFEIEEMYPTYLETAKFQNEKGAQLSFHYALSAEKTHAEFFSRARETIDSGKQDIELGQMNVCSICGYTHEGDTPERCPICGAKQEKFQVFPG